MSRSQGFATFCEDPVHSLALRNMARDNPDMDVFMGHKLKDSAVWTEGAGRLRSIIRYQTLKSEVEQTTEDGQRMRPMQGGN